MKQQGFSLAEISLKMHMSVQKVLMLLSEDASQNNTQKPFP